jgi:thioredoxin-like negative regulator of GroEL
MKQLIYFYGTFCNPCKSFRPTIDALSREYPVRFVDVDQEPQLVAEHGIRSVPTIVVVENGQSIEKKSGVLTEGQLRSMLS